MGQGDRQDTELRLVELEERVEIATFLASLSSVFLVTWTMMFALVSVLVPGNTARWSVSLAFCLIFFLWSSAISHIWRTPILLGAILVAGAIATYPISQMLERAGEVDWPVKIVFGIGALISIAFGVQIVRDGWRLARTSDNSSRLLTTVPYDRFAVMQICARAFGIHPICQWLPNRTRRVLARLLFALTTGALALTLGVAIYLVMTELSSLVPAAHDTCRRVRESTNILVPCTMEIISATIAPAIALATCLAAVAGSRWLARRSTRVSLEAVSKTDKRAAIVFLRSFKDDQVQLVLPKRPPFRRLLALGEPAPRLDHVLLEEATPIGPVVAIGLPGKKPPFGAARVYVDAGEWKRAVATLASKARAVVVVADETEGVLWELSHIRQAGLVSKTLYLLPPRLSGAKEAAQIIRRELAPICGPHTIAAAAAALGSGLACVGWYHTVSGQLRVLTTRIPTSTSYVCALRLALSSLSDHMLAGFSVIERPEKPTKIGGRWIGPLVALAMLLPLATVVWLQVQNRESARAIHSRVQLKTLNAALERYRIDVGDYPTQEMGLHALVQAPAQVRGWSGPYVAGDSNLLDPWGRPYIYRVPGAIQPFDILSLGRDGRQGGTGEDADITNWD